MYLIGKMGKSKKTLSKNIQNFLGDLATQPRPLPGKPRPPIWHASCLWHAPCNSTIHTIVLCG